MVSIVVPVYNSEKYLAETLSFLQNQTYDDIEIICVDDGSTDESVTIIEKFFKNDKRVRLIRQKNLFAGVARNNGLEHIRGEYVVFFDADDIFDYTLIEKCLKQARKTDADIVLYGGKILDMLTGKNVPAAWFFQYDKVKQWEVFNRHSIPNEIMNITNLAPWTKFYKTSFIRKNKIYISLC